MNLKEIIFGFAIFILTMFVTTYGTNIFFIQPQYNDFCKISYDYKINESQIEIEKRFEEQRICDVNYRNANNDYSMNIFFIAIPLGIILILIGAFLFSLNAVGIGIMCGGIGTILRGIGAYWQYSDNLVKFFISLFGLIAIIYCSYKFGEKLGFSHNKKRKNG